MYPIVFTAIFHINIVIMVRNWLAEHGNPRPIAAKGKKYRVKYAS